MIILKNGSKVPEAQSSIFKFLVCPKPKGIQFIKIYNTEKQESSNSCCLYFIIIVQQSNSSHIEYFAFFALSTCVLSSKPAEPLAPNWWASSQVNHRRRPCCHGSAVTSLSWLLQHMFHHVKHTVDVWSWGRSTDFMQLFPPCSHWLHVIRSVSLVRSGLESGTLSATESSDH